MALFEDKNKPVNIYAKGTATAKAQESTSKVSPLAGAAKVAGIVSTPPRKLFDTVTKPLQNAMTGQDAALGRQQLRSTILKTPQGEPAGFRQVENPRSMIAPRMDAIKERINGFATNQTITGTPAAQRAGMTGSRVVGGNMPGYTPQFGPAAQPGVREAIVKTPQAQMQTVYQNQGNRISATQQPVRERVMRPQGVPNSIKTGGYSVQFSPNASQSQRAAFAGSGESGSEAARAAQREQFLARNGQAPVDPIMEAISGLRPAQRTEALLNRERVNLDRARVNLDRFKTEGDLSLGQERLGIERGNLGVNQKESDIRGRVAESQITGNEFEIDTKKEARDRQNEINRMRDAYAKIPAADTERKKAAWQELIDRGFVQQQPEEYEFKTVKQPMNQDMTGGGETLYKVGKRGGNAEKVAGEDAPPQAPPEALERLKKYKDYDNFKAKYGYIPAGY